MFWGTTLGKNNVRCSAKTHRYRQSFRINSRQNLAPDHDENQGDTNLSC